MPTFKLDFPISFNRSVFLACVCVRTRFFAGLRLPGCNMKSRNTLNVNIRSRSWDALQTATQVLCPPLLHRPAPKPAHSRHSMKACGISNNKCVTFTHIFNPLRGTQPITPTFDLSFGLQKLCTVPGRRNPPVFTGALLSKDRISRSPSSRGSQFSAGG